MRTREAGAPIESPVSTETLAIGFFTAPWMVFATALGITLRNSTSTVSGSGRVSE